MAGSCLRYYTYRKILAAQMVYVVIFLGQSTNVGAADSCTQVPATMYLITVVQSSRDEWWHQLRLIIMKTWIKKFNTLAYISHFWRYFCCVPDYNCRIYETLQSGSSTHLTFLEVIFVIICVRTFGYKNASQTQHWNGTLNTFCKPICNYKVEEILYILIS